MKPEGKSLLADGLSPRARGTGIRLFDQDPDLLTGVPPGRASLLRQNVVVKVERLSAGVWDPRPSRQPGRLGLMVIEGALARWVNVAGRTSAELIGPGDVVKPWLESEAISVTGEVTWTAEQETTIAELGPEFARQVAGAPEVGAALLDRALGRTQRFALGETIATMPGVDERLLLMLWHLADRWGRVTREGIVVPVVLTHRLLAALIGASRPTVSSAVASLTRQGCLARRDDRTWLLMGEPPRRRSGADDEVPSVGGDAATADAH